MYNEDDETPNECEGSNCEAQKGARMICMCIHCGGELIEVNEMWYHWTQFDFNGNLISPERPQDFVKIK